ncbi:phage tail tape measure protein [Priestia sp. SB1]|uniref:phage tail tape measure protein n=1 Tax=Priestia sp. SB1 TaxID=3132359 RepID=UPI003179E4BE
MANDIRILLNASLDFSKTQEAINNQIGALEKKVNKLKINIDINDNTIKTMQQFSRAVEDYKKSYDKLNQAVQQNEKIVKNADGTIDKYSTRILKNGEILKTHTQTIDNRNKAIKNESKAISDNLKVLQRQEELQKRVNKTKADGKSATTETYGDKYMSTSYKKDNSGKVVDKTTTENFAKADRDIERLKIKLNELNNAGVVTNSSLSRMSQAIDASSTEKEIKRIENALKRVQQTAKAKASTTTLSNNISNFQTNAELDAKKLRRSARGSVDNAALQDYLNKVRQLNTTTPNAQNEMKKLRSEFKRINIDARTSASAMEEFGRTSVDAFKKFGHWLLIGGTFTTVIAGMKDMVGQIIEIDTAMTDLRRVMDAPEAGYSNYLKEAINLSNELGNSIKDVINIGTDFARMGFSEDQLLNMTKTAQVLQNISDLDASQSVDTLTAAMLNFGIEARDSLTIADQLNEVDNNFAISTKDLADGIRKAGSTAKTFGELIAT